MICARGLVTKRVCCYQVLLSLPRSPIFPRTLIVECQLIDPVLLPWQIHPALTEERLTLLANVMWQVRVDVSLRMEPDKVDSLWGAGCSAYERTCRAVTQAATQDLRPWLSGEYADHHFLIKVGGVPIRFYRGDADDRTPSRYSIPNEAERVALQFAFNLSETPTPDKVLRIEVATDARSYPLSVTLVQVNVQGEKFNPFIIPVAKDAVRPILRRKPAVALNPPEVLSNTDRSTGGDSGEMQTSA